MVNKEEQKVQERPEPTTDAPTERPEVETIPVLYTERERVLMEMMADLSPELFPIMDVCVDRETMRIRSLSFHNVELGENIFDDPNIIVKRWDEREKPEGSSRPNIFGDPIKEEDAKEMRGEE